MFAKLRLKENTTNGSQLLTSADTSPSIVALWVKCVEVNWKAKAFDVASNLVFIFAQVIHQKSSVRRCVCGLKPEWYLATFSGFVRWEAELRLKYFIACVSEGFSTKRIELWWSPQARLINIWSNVWQRCRDIGVLGMTSYYPRWILTTPCVVGWSCTKVEW